MSVSVHVYRVYVRTSLKRLGGQIYSNKFQGEGSLRGKIQIQGRATRIEYKGKPISKVGRGAN